MADKQPEALRLAQGLNNRQECEDDAADELRRLAKVAAQRDALLAREKTKNEALLEACKTLVNLPGTEDWAATLRLAVEQARAAIAKAEKGGGNE